MAVRNFVWAAEPPHAQLLYAFLAVVCLVTLVRAGVLAWTLLALPGRKRVSIDDVAEGIDANRLAASAVAGAIRGDGRGHPLLAGRHELDRLMRTADARFAYRWHVAHARALATKGLSRLTVLVSVAIVAFGVYPTMALALYEPFNISEQTAWLRGVHLLMTRLAIGLAVSAVVGAVGVFFEGCLIRRKASWRLFHAVVTDAAPKPKE